MKAIIVALLLIILGIVGYNYYNTWKRFNPPNYQYNADVTVDPNHPDKALLLDYHQAIQQLDGYVITQWTANEIDVRNPEDDDATTLAAVVKYNDLKGTVTFYESQLTAPLKPLKKEEDHDPKKRLVYDMFLSNPQANSFRLGQKSPLVFEVQKLLNKKGDTIKVDGVYNIETKTALEKFEEKQGFFVDGKLDHITLKALLKD